MDAETSRDPAVISGQRAGGGQVSHKRIMFSGTLRPRFKHVVNNSLIVEELGVNRVAIDHYRGANVDDSNLSYWSLLSYNCLTKWNEIT